MRGHLLHMHVHMCARVYSCIWRSEDHHWCRNRVSHWSGAHQVGWLASEPRRSPVSLLFPLRVFVTIRLEHLLIPSTSWELPASTNTQTPSPTPSAWRKLQPDMSSLLISPFPTTRPRVPAQGLFLTVYGHSPSSSPMLYKASLL